MTKKKKITGNKEALKDLNHSSNYHTPVLLAETIEQLRVHSNGVYVDCTFGGGGHAKAILELLGPDGRLFAFDQDEDAKRNVPADQRVTFIPHNFRHVQRMLKLHGVTAIDGILADLGVSSHQFNEAARGFSYRYEAALDMRMDQRQKRLAADILNEYTAEQLQRMFGEYGEVTNAKTLGAKIVAARATGLIHTIDQLKNAIREIVKGNPNKYFAQVFQALRIEVNDELGAIRELLNQIPPLLKPGGRAAIITFHSLEDRLVKHFFRRGTFKEPDENPFTNEESVNELTVITRKPILPSEKELNENPRSRSAKLRIAEKVMMV
jgi:16S rRNA (cytosine1402-N4)-methyltransferase